MKSSRVVCIDLGKSPAIQQPRPAWGEWVDAAYRLFAEAVAETTDGRIDEVDWRWQVSCRSFRLLSEAARKALGVCESVPVDVVLGYRPRLLGIAFETVKEMQPDQLRLVRVR